MFQTKYSFLLKEKYQPIKEKYQSILQYCFVFIILIKEFFSATLELDNKLDFTRNTKYKARLLYFLVEWNWIEIDPVVSFNYPYSRSRLGINFDRIKRSLRV